MLTPEGYPANNIDKIMLLSMWADHLQTNESPWFKVKHPFISVSMGKPTLPIHRKTCQFMVDYWTTVSGKNNNPAISYGSPQGDLKAREKMAAALSIWYETEIISSNILFTIGGAGALHIIFKTLHLHNKTCPNFRIITPTPYYTLYATCDNNLHFIPVMQNSGYSVIQMG